MSRALELLEHILGAMWFRDGRKDIGPGQVVLNLPQSQRDILSELTSAEMKNVRPDYIFGENNAK